MELPQYKCHKTVRAAKIADIRRLPDMRGRLYLRLPTEPGMDAGRIVDVVEGNEWMAKHMPVTGGYYVQYEDGYTSYSPSKAFEDGYTMAEHMLYDLESISAEDAAAVLAESGAWVVVKRDHIAPAPFDHLANPKPAILTIRNRAGDLLLTMDEDGQIALVSPDLDVSNGVPERIVSAAAGGLDVHHLPPELKSVFLGDVEIADFGMSFNEPPWMRLHVPDPDEFDALWGINPLALLGRLAREDSTLRCLIFEGDLVHEAQEPEHDPRLDGECTCGGIEGREKPWWCDFCLAAMEGANPVPITRLSGTEELP